MTSTHPTPQTVLVALTGASGIPYGLRLIETLVAAGCRVWIVYSQVAQIVARQEADLLLPVSPQQAERELSARFSAATGQIRVFGRDDWNSPPASGSNPPDAMVVCPCSMGTLAAIAHGLASSLIERAADVVMKERRPLILAVILPPSPGFYQQPQSIADLVDFVVARILDQLRVPHTLLPRWGEQRLED